MTKSTGVGRGRKGIPRKPYSHREGKKLCRGTTHSPGGKWLPATEGFFYKRSAGLSKQFLSQCRQCRSHRYAKNKRKAYGYVTVFRVRFALVELERRLGRTEAARRCKISNLRWKSIMDGKQHRVERETVRRVFLVVRETRAKNEVRHRRDIKWGRAMRGFVETRKPAHPEDFYRSTGDGDAEQQRKHRREKKAA